jgi:hypothetical protein
MIYDATTDTKQREKENLAYLSGGGKGFYSRQSGDEVRRLE